MAKKVVKFNSDGELVDIVKSMPKELIKHSSILVFENFEDLYKTLYDNLEYSYRHILKITDEGYTEFNLKELRDNGIIIDLNNEEKTIHMDEMTFPMIWAIPTYHLMDENYDDNYLGFIYRNHFTLEKMFVKEEKVEVLKLKKDQIKHISLIFTDEYVVAKINHSEFTILFNHNKVLKYGYKYKIKKDLIESVDYFLDEMLERKMITFISDE